MCRCFITSTIQTTLVFRQTLVCLSENSVSVFEKDFHWFMVVWASSSNGINTACVMLTNKSTWIVPLQTGETRDEVACPLLGGLHRQEHRSGLLITLHPEHRVNFLRCLWKGIFNPSQLYTHKQKEWKEHRDSHSQANAFLPHPEILNSFLKIQKVPFYPVIDVFHVLCLVQWVP